MTCLTDVCACVCVCEYSVLFVWKLFFCGLILPVVRFSLITGLYVESISNNDL